MSLHASSTASVDGMSISQIRHSQSPSDSDFHDDKLVTECMLALKNSLISLTAMSCGVGNIGKIDEKEEGGRSRYSSDTMDSGIKSNSGPCSPATTLSEPADTEWSQGTTNDLWGLSDSFGFLGLSLADPPRVGEEREKMPETFNYSCELRLNHELRLLLGDREFVPRPSSTVQCKLKSDVRGNQVHSPLNDREERQTTVDTVSILARNEQHWDQQQRPHTSLFTSPFPYPPLLSPFLCHFPVTPINYYVPSRSDVDMNLLRLPAVITSSLGSVMNSPPLGFFLSLCYCPYPPMAPYPMDNSPLGQPSPSHSMRLLKRNSQQSKTSGTSDDSGVDSGSRSDNWMQEEEKEENEVRECIEERNNMKSTTEVRRHISSFNVPSAFDFSPHHNTNNRVSIRIDEFLPVHTRWTWVHRHNKSFWVTEVERLE